MPLSSEFRSMETDNVVTAPQIADIAACYGKWRQTHNGSLDYFVKFMTEPTVERDRFVDSSDPTIKFNGSVLATTVLQKG